MKLLSDILIAVADCWDSRSGSSCGSRGKTVVSAWCLSGEKCGVGKLGVKVASRVLRREEK